MLNSCADYGRLFLGPGLCQLLLLFGDGFNQGDLALHMLFLPCLFTSVRRANAFSSDTLALSDVSFAIQYRRTAM